MVSENLARKFKPAGFEQPEGSRQKYTKPRAELKEAFEGWLKNLPRASDLSGYRMDVYKAAKDYIKHFDRIDSDEANSLLIGFDSRNGKNKFAGLFVSACYSKSPEDAIVFDIDAEGIEFIGYRCYKPLMNNGLVGDNFGFDSQLVINNRVAGNNCGEHSRTAINNGKSGYDFGKATAYMVISNGETGPGFAEHSINFIISVCEPKNHGAHPFQPVILDPKDCAEIPELKRYLDDLKTQTSGSTESIQNHFRKYGALPHRAIEDEIKQILIDGGVEI